MDPEDNQQAKKAGPRARSVIALLAGGCLCLLLALTLVLVPVQGTSTWMPGIGAGLAFLLGAAFFTYALRYSLRVATASGSLVPGALTLPSGRAGRRGRGTVLKILLVAGLIVGLLPILAILRGAAVLLASGTAYTGAEWVGLGFAFLALLMGTLFFAYSIKYYVSTAIVLIAAMALTRIGRRTDTAGGPSQGRINHHAPDAAYDVRVDLGYEPFVSVHVATYNEKRVLQRLLEACAHFDYGNYEVVVVDDSTDESTQILERWQGYERFKIIHRPNRDGFKGGALQQALSAMDHRAEYVVIFDADSIPFPDSLQRFLVHFYEKKNGNGGPDPPRRREAVGAVQSYQWHVLNKSESWLTEAVRTEYAGSYMVERPFQEAVGSLKMIAGTAYMIRADLLQALGWGRSLTEDWELTLRLYVQGFKVVYTPYAETPAECVATFSRLARQRMRWAEGHTYNVRKWFGSIMRSPAISRLEKLEFLFYATYYLQAALFIVGSVSWLLAEIVFKVRIPEWTALAGWSLLFSNLLSLPLMNVSGLVLERAPLKDFNGVLGALATSFLLVPFQAWAAVRGLFERTEGPWYRTPKTGRITDPVAHLHRLGRLRRWLFGPRRGVFHAASPTRIEADPRPRSPSPRRLGWILSAALVLALGGVGFGALHAPVVYANPDTLYLRNAVSAENAADETLNVQGSTGVTKVFSSNATVFTWLTATSYPSGSVAAGTYTFVLDWSANGCGSNCPITITWGFCNSGCTTLQPAAATFTTDLNGLAASGTQTLTASGTAITLSGCPCRFYVEISSSPQNQDTWTLAYNGPTAGVNDTHIVTPLLPVPERLLALLGLSLLVPALVMARQRPRGKARPR